jgi:hypothetical protein
VEERSLEDFERAFEEFEQEMTRKEKKNQEKLMFQFNNALNGKQFDKEYLPVVEKFHEFGSQMRKEIDKEILLIFSSSPSGNSILAEQRNNRRGTSRGLQRRDQTSVFRK